MYETTGECIFCGEPPVLWDLPGAHGVEHGGCCLAAQEALAGGLDATDIWGTSLEEQVGDWHPNGAPQRVLWGEDHTGELHQDCVASWKLEVAPLDRATAHAYIDAHHRHHPAPIGEIFRLGCYNGVTLVGVITVGRPVSRVLQQRHPDMLEVTRVCAQGDARLKRNVCSKLYAEACKAAKRRGYRALITYTLETEPGTTLRAAGWVEEARGCGGGSWSSPSRPREDKAPTCPKVRWRKVVNKKLRPVVPPGHQAGLFA